MSRYKDYYYKPEGWIFKNNFLEGTRWTVGGSKEGSEYTITLKDKGFTCTCSGFTFRGKCKHTVQVVEKFDESY